MVTTSKKIEKVMKRVPEVSKETELDVLKQIKEYLDVLSDGVVCLIETNQLILKSIHLIEEKETHEAG